MDISGIMARHEANRARWLTVGGVDLLVRRPSRREVVVLVEGIEAANPRMVDVFEMVRRCLPFVEDWRNVTDADGQAVPFNPETLAIVVDDDLDLGHGIVDAVMGEYQTEQAEVAAEKKA